MKVIECSLLKFFFSERQASKSEYLGLEQRSDVFWFDSSFVAVD